MGARPDHLENASVDLREETAARLRARRHEQVGRFLKDARTDPMLRVIKSTDLSKANSQIEALFDRTDIAVGSTTNAPD